MKVSTLPNPAFLQRLVNMQSRNQILEVGRFYLSPSLWKEQKDLLTLCPVKALCTYCVSHTQLLRRSHSQFFCLLWQSRLRLKLKSSGCHIDLLMSFFLLIQNRGFPNSYKDTCQLNQKYSHFMGCTQRLFLWGTFVLQCHGLNGFLFQIITQLM